MRGRDFRMADKKKNRKPMTSQRKGLIALAVMLVLTVCVSWIAVAGMKLDSAGVNVLLPWLPLTAGNVPESLTLGLDLSEGGNHEISYRLVTPAPTAAPTAEPAAEEDAADAVEGAADAVVDAVEGAADAVADAAEGAADAVADAAEGAAEAAGDAVDAVADAAEGAADAVADAAEGAADAVADAAEGAADAVADTVEAVEEAVATAIPAAFRNELEAAAEIIRKRVNAMGRSANVEIINEKTLRISYPNYINVNADENVTEAIAMCAELTGEVSLRDANGDVITDENGIVYIGVINEKYNPISF